MNSLEISIPANFLNGNYRITVDGDYVSGNCTVCGWSCQLLISNYEDLAEAREVTACMILSHQHLT